MGGSRDDKDKLPKVKPAPQAELTTFRAQRSHQASPENPSPPDSSRRSYHTPSPPSASHAAIVPSHREKKVAAKPDSLGDALHTSRIHLVPKPPEKKQAPSRSSMTGRTQQLEWLTNGVSSAAAISAPAVENKKPQYRRLSAKEILQATGIPPVFAKILKQQSKITGAAFAIRAGSPFQRYLMPAASKPSFIKAKIGNWGFTKGVLAVKAYFGKTKKSLDDTCSVLPRDEKDIPKNCEALGTVLHKLSIQEILAGIRSGEYILDPDNDISKTNRLVVRSGDDNTPDDDNTLLSIDLSDIARSVKQHVQIKFENVTVDEKNGEPKPDWWDENKWGTFSEVSSSYYVAQSKEAWQEDYEDIPIYGVKTKEGVLPITGDQDLLWMTMPVEIQKKLAEINDVINTFAVDGVDKMIDARDRLHRALFPKDAHLPHLEAASIARVGCMRPYESFISDKVNALVANEIDHLRDLFQHGAENRNPGALSLIDAPMVHVWNGELYMTETEEDLIDFTMQDGYLKDNILDIHPQWNMAKWAPVVAKQITLGHPIAKEVEENFNKFIASYEIKPRDNTQHWKAVAQIQIEQGIHVSDAVKNRFLLKEQDRHREETQRIR